MAINLTPPEYANLGTIQLALGCRVYGIPRYRDWGWRRLNLAVKPGYPATSWLPYSMPGATVGEQYRPKDTAGKA